MAKPMHISEIYASQLEELACGYPLWRPDGLKDEFPVEIGSVGYIEDGAFVEMFNAKFTANDPRNEKGQVPPNHVPFNQKNLRYSDLDDDMDPGPYSSKSVRHSKTGAGASSDLPVVANGGAGYTFTVSEEKGALLYIPHSAKKRSIRNGTGVIDYLKRNFNDWYNFAKENGFSRTQCRDMVLVSGHVKTVEWTVAAIRARHAASQADLDAGFSAVGNVFFEWNRSSSSTGSLQSRTGPKKRTEASRSPSPSIKSMVDQINEPTHAHRDSLSAARPPTPKEAECDQCIFLKYYKVKWRIGRFVLRAGAGPDNLPSDHTGDGADINMDSESDQEMDNNPPAHQIYSSVDVLLDYILQNSEADAAIACHDDIDMLLLGHEPPSNLAEFLSIHSPRIHVTDDKVGTLSLEELISKERVWRITAGNPATTDVPDTTNEDEADDDAERRDGEADPSGLQYGDVLLGNRPDGGSIRWPHVLYKDKETDAGAVSAIALSPDGKLVAAGFDDPNVRLWRCKDGSIVTVFEGHSEPIWAVSFSPDGARMVSASEDSRMLVWDVLSSDPSPIMVLEGHTSDVSHAIYSPDGKLIASGSVDCTVKIWDAVSGDCLHTLDGLSTNIMSMEFTPDSARVVACADSIAKIWSVDTGRELATMKGHRAAIWCIAVSHAGDRIATSSEDMTCRVWESTTGEELVTIAEHTGPVWSVAWSPDDKELITGSYDCTTMISNSFDGTVRHILERGNPAPIIDAVGWSPTGEVVCSGSADGLVRLWDPQSGAFIAEYQGHTDKVKDIVFTHDGNEVITASDDGTVRKWSVQDALRLCQT